MALPTSGAMTLDMIAAEFGGAAPHGLTEYYGVAAGVPTSGTISTDHFYGKSAIQTMRFTLSNPFIDYGGFFNGAGYIQGGGGSLSPSDIFGSPVTVFVHSFTAPDKLQVACSFLGLLEIVGVRFQNGAALGAPYTGAAQHGGGGGLRWNTPVDPGWGAGGTYWIDLLYK